MFNSDKRPGFLTGTPGGAVTRTPVVKKPAAPETMMPRPTPPVTSLPNPVVGPVPKPAPRTAPVNTAAVNTGRVIRDRLSDQNRGTGSMPAAKTSGINVDRFGKVMSPGRGLWSNLTAQMAPGRWFNRGS